MKILGVTLEELRHKHYDTVVYVDVEDELGQEYPMKVSISGYYPLPSEREVKSGWEPDWGMDHTESEAHLEIAKKIMEALQR